jgi:hypothetical protein
MIHIVQCMCPCRHAIFAIAYDEKAIDTETATRGFAALVEGMIETNTIRRRCSICHKDVEFHYEDGVTKFQTMEEAMPHLKCLEDANIYTNLLVSQSRN